MGSDEGTDLLEVGRNALAPDRPHRGYFARLHRRACRADRKSLQSSVQCRAAPAENYRISEIANIVADVVPGCRIEYAADAGPDKRCYRVRFAQDRSVLPDFKPQWTARVGVEQVYQAFKASGLTLEEFEGPRYQRIAHIKKLLADGIIDFESPSHHKHRSLSGAVLQLRRLQSCMRTE